MALLAHPAAAARSKRSTDALLELGFVNPTTNGGSWLTKWNNWWAGGEPLNAVVVFDPTNSSSSEQEEYDTFLDYCSSLKFSAQCFQWQEKDSVQAANLGDGNELVNQTTLLRYNYDDPAFGTCSETFQGGNHFRVFRQNGILANTGAWFLAVSKEHNLAKNHAIIANGYDLGRDELVRIALADGGTTTSPVSGAEYKTSVRAVSGHEYLGRVTIDEMNHGVGTDGRIAILTVEVVRKGNGRFGHLAAFTSVTLGEFLIFLAVAGFCAVALFVFLAVHYHHVHRGGKRTGTRV